MVAWGTEALLASPALTGTPTAPTASPGTSTTQVATTAFVEAAEAAGLTLLATTGPNGYPLVNGTGTIIAATVANDGNLHRFMIFSTLYVASAATGGAIQIMYTLPGLGASFHTLYSASQASTPITATISGLTPVITAGSTVTLSQNTALTGGAATMYAEIWDRDVPQLQLNETADVVLDGSGNGTAKLGPTGPQETWTPSNVSVICSTNTAEATCKVYAGPSASAPYFKDITVDGSTGDATDKCNIPVPKGWFVWAVWTGGDAGATATVNVDGVKQVP